MKTIVSIPAEKWEEWDAITDPWDYIKGVWAHVLGKPLAQVEGTIDPTAYALSKEDWIRAGQEVVTRTEGGDLARSQMCMEWMNVAPSSVP